MTLTRLPPAGNVCGLAFRGFSVAEALRLAPLHVPGFPVGYDQQWCHELYQRGWAVAVQWEVRCGHIRQTPEGWRDYA